MASQVIGSDCGEIPNIIRKTQGGWIFSEGSLAGLTEIIEHVKSNPAETNAKRSDWKGNGCPIVQ